MIRKALLTLILMLSFVINVTAQNKIWDETPTEKTERMAWWTDARFGMFIH